MGAIRTFVSHTITFERHWDKADSYLELLPVSEKATLTPICFILYRKIQLIRRPMWHEWTNESAKIMTDDYNTSAKFSHVLLSFLSTKPKQATNLGSRSCDSKYIHRASQIIIKTIDVSSLIWKWIVSMQCKACSPSNDMKEKIFRTSEQRKWFHFVMVVMFVMINLQT